MDETSIRFISVFLMIWGMKQVLLIYPSQTTKDLEKDPDFETEKSVPLGVLYLASFLESKGYKVKFLDGRIYPKKELLIRVKGELNNCDCVGISAMTPQVEHAIQITDFIKEQDKDMPIIWGGMHATLFPEQTCKDKNIDYVIYGEAEYAMHKFMRFLSGKLDIKKVDALVYKKDGKIIKNDLGEKILLDKVPPPAYHLLDIERYINREFYGIDEVKKLRGLDFPTSRGCPYRCAFCTNILLPFKNWRPLDVEKVKENLDLLIKKYKLNHIWFRDDFFFGNKERVREIANHLVKNHNITWEGNIRVDDFDRMDDEFLSLLKKSGCYCLRMGLESGSDRVLRLLKKDIKVSQIINAAKQCNKHDIIPLGTFMAGIPGERLDEVKDTIRMIIKLEEIAPKGIFYAPAILRPYPGTELYSKCKEAGFKEARSVREWTEKKLEFDLDCDPKEVPWVDNASKVIELLAYLRIKQSLRRKTMRKERLWQVYGIAEKLIDFRFKNNFFALPIEARLGIFVKKIR